MIKFKNENKENKKGRKKFLIAGGIGLLTVLGGTLAYFTTSTNITNKFKAALYQNEIVEVFTAPDTWTPGTTTSKTVAVTNNGNINMAVRAKYTEKWTSASGKTLSLTTSDNARYAIITFGSDWTLADDGFYYYGSKDNKTILAQGKTSSSFIQSVKFNENTTASLKETKSEDGQTITYTSTGDGYDNATYSLEIRIDTIQYDQANSVWK